MTTQPVTDAHREKALQTMNWPGWTLAKAMAHPTRREIIEARAKRFAWLSSTPNPMPPSPHRKA